MWKSIQTIRILFRRFHGGAIVLTLARDARSLAQPWSRERARNQASDLERAIKTVDASVAALKAENTEQGPIENIPKELKGAIERAQTIYNEAVAREQRAAALQAHGVFARQELEEAQVAVRTASDSLALLRRESEAAAKLAWMAVGVDVVGRHCSLI